MKLCISITCDRAGQLLPDEDFYLHNERPQRMSVCKECHKRRVTVEQRRRRQLIRERNVKRIFILGFIERYRKEVSFTYLRQTKGRLLGCGNPESLLEKNLGK